jgi:hypothetical protein
MIHLTTQELQLIKKLKTPALIQDYLNSLTFNKELDGVHTIRSPFKSIRTKTAHCFEGALLGAYLLSCIGYKPLILTLIASRSKTGKKGTHDSDHCIAPFKINGYWGALSKTNHAVLRYRDPVYKSLRELVMSYFHEYFYNDTGIKTLRYYTDTLNLNQFDDEWKNSEEDLWGIDETIDAMTLHDIVPRQLVGKLRKADSVERLAGAITADTLR